jgi:HD-like signal output (HDOD) protein
MPRTTPVEKVIERVGDLPAAPAVVAEVLQLTDNPLTDMDAVGKVIERDPGVAAKILRVSNSAYYGMKQYVGTLKLALVILGVREIRNIVLGVSVYESFAEAIAMCPPLQRFWPHAFLVGGLSRRLAGRMGLKMGGEAFVGGLLHDMGKLVLLRQLHDRYANVLEQAGGAGESLCEAERVEFGFTHADAGAALAQQWHFPRPLADSIRFHHAVPDVSLESAKDPALAAVVRVADRAAHAGALTLGQNDTATPGEEEAWRVLARVPEPIGADARSAVLRGLLAELKDSDIPEL